MPKYEKRLETYPLNHYGGLESEHKWKISKFR